MKGTPMNTIQKIKQKIKDHRYEIIAVGFVTALVALTVVAENKTLEQQQKAQQELDNYIVDQNRKGKTVYQLADGSYIGVAVE